MSSVVILLPRKGYLQHFGTKIAKIVRCYCHDQGQSERNIFDFSLCVANMLSIDYLLFAGVDLNICLLSGAFCNLNPPFYADRS